MIIDFDSKNKGGGGKEPVVESLSVTENGIYNAPSGVDGYNPVDVHVPQREPVLDSLSVTDNGTYTPSVGVDGYNSVSVNVPKEHHNVTSKSITANGTYNSDGDDVWNEVSVNVFPKLETLNATDNGTYTPSAGKDGFDSVEVNVPKEHHNVTSKSITANGTYNSEGDDVWNSVDVNVPERQPVLESLSVNANGTYNAPSNIDGYNTVSVNVPQKTFNKTSVTKEYTSNGQYSIATPDGYDGISDVSVTVNVATSGGGTADYSDMQFKRNLTELDTTKYNSVQWTDLSYKFNGCKFTSLDLSGWDTSNVTDMGYLFQDCSSLTSLDLSSWDTRKVTNIDFSLKNRNLQDIKKNLALTKKN